MSDDLTDHPLRVTGQPRRGLDLTVAIPIAVIVIGAVLLFAGYWGASDTANPGDQIPHLASGTVPGLALVIAGAVLLLRREHERDREELRALTARFDAVLDWLATADAPADGPAISDNGARPTSERAHER